MLAGGIGPRLQRWGRGGKVRLPRREFGDTPQGHPRSNVVRDAAWDQRAPSPIDSDSTRFLSW